MIISHKHRYLFVELPHTASSAIRHELREYYDGVPILQKHSYYHQFLEIASEQEQRYFVFSTIRNPLDVTVTLYFKYKSNHKGAFTNPNRWKANGGDITDLELKLSDREQDILNPLNINVIRDFRDNGRGLRIWGSRCLTSDSAWKYVPVRRLFIFLEESMDEGLQWVVFEPNGEVLWARVRRTLNGFLRRIWLDGALAGVTEDEAFFVRCDRTTMTEDDIANGRLIVLVGVAPLRPAEFVIIRIGQKTLEATS